MKNIIIVFIIIALGMPSLASADDSASGLILKEEGAFDGYILFGPIGSKTTYLIDNDGQIVHSWESERGQQASAYLLENGNLLRTVLFGDMDFMRSGFEELTWGGTVVWEFEYFMQHHDVEPLPNGNVLMITEEIISGTEATTLGRDPLLVGNNAGKWAFLKNRDTRIEGK